ncbi:MAG: NAD(P)/FAD-dependent oxidoreductase [Lysobacteraceae bacterium]
MISAMRIAIVGYGTAGQTLAVALSRDGHRVEVFERVPEPGPVGAGFLLQPTGLSVLWELGLLDAALEHGALVRRLYGETIASRAVMDMRYRELHPALFGLGLQRGAIFELLDSAWTESRRIHCGREIVHVDHDRGVLRDEHGDEDGPFDLVIVADGSASKLRAGIGEVVFDRPYPWGAQWCLVPAGDWPWPDELRQRYRHARRMVGMLPVGTRPGDPIPRLSFFWSLPAVALADAGRDEVRWRAEVAEIWPEAARCLLTTAVPEGLAQARYRDTVVRRWFRGRAVLVGDAAHAMSPQLGQGVNMALADALALRDALRAAATLPEALDGYQRVRRRHLGIYHFWSRWLTPLFQSEHDRIAGLRDLLFHPLSRVPGGRGQSLRVLTGTRRGWFGRWPLSPDFIERLSNAGEQS